MTARGFLCAANLSVALSKPDLTLRAPETLDNYETVTPNQVDHRCDFTAHSFDIMPLMVL